MNRFALLGLFALLVASSPQAQVTGLSGWSLFLDPGHSQDGNVGVYGYSEARKVLRIGLALREMLLGRTDIDTVYISRTNDTQDVSLSQRVDAANISGSDYFHSIHSNAGAPGTNHLFVLWPQLQSGAEGSPTGGRAMAEEMGPALAEGMRISTRGTNGGFGECDFYGTSSCRTSVSKGSRNFVQSFTTMASTLSEAGFHTNPTQNTRNMNAEWKRLEAQAMYWAILDWHGIDRSVHRIATGIVSDVENGRPLNGASITIDGQTYTTDTYETLFNAYSNDPNELANGFYYLEDLGAGTHAVTVEADGYGTFTGEITMQDTTFSFLDVALLSVVPPIVTASSPEPDAPAFRITDALTVTFSRPMDPATTAAAFSLVPAAGGSPVEGTTTVSGRTLTFRPTSSLSPQTEYTLTIAATAMTGLGGDALDGDADGTGGDPYSLRFTTGFADTMAPRLVASYPRVNAQDVEIRPVVTVAFDELVEEPTLEGRVGLETGSGTPVAGRFVASVVGEQTTLSFAPDAPLAPDTPYRFVLQEGVSDPFDNATSGRLSVPFRTGTFGIVETVIDDFEGSSVADDWWVPQQSGSTMGIVTDSTNARATTQANLLSGTGALALDYGWDTGATGWLIRECFNNCAPGSVRFDASATLQAYVFGDGKGTLFRFAVDDASSIEVSPWVEVDWIGWRPVTWDLTADGTGSWIGNGVLDGTLTFESLQLGYQPGSPAFGRLLVDDLRLIETVSIDQDGGPDELMALMVEAPRPNPSRGETVVPVRLAAPSALTARIYNALGQEVAVLAEGTRLEAGRHALTWDARGSAPGVYLIRIEAAGQVETQRVTVVR